MFKFIHIDKNSLEIVEVFIKGLGSGLQSFRYFEKRPVSIVLDHIVTVIMANEEGVSIAYGHLERESNRTWLGVAVAEMYQGKKVGLSMMRYLLDYAKSHGEKEITLTVDKSNYKAITLYEKLKFSRELEFDSYFQYIYHE